MHIQLYIVNSFDRPSEKFLAEKGPDGLYYIHPNLRSEKIYHGMSDKEATKVEDFGIVITLHPLMIEGQLLNPSTATYADGRTRQWQGSSHFMIPLA